MTNTLDLTPQTIGLAAAGAASLGLTLAEGLLTPTNRLKELAARRQNSSTPRATRAERRAANRAAHAAAQGRAAGAPTPPPATAPTTGLLELLGGDAEDQHSQAH